MILKQFPHSGPRHDIYNTNCPRTLGSEAFNHSCYRSVRFFTICSPCCSNILFQYIVTIYCSNVHPIHWSDILIQFIVPNCFNILFQYIDSIYGFDMLFHIIPSLSLHAHGLSDLCHIIIITIFNGKFSLLSQKLSSPLSPYELNFSLGPPGLRRLCPQWGSPSSWLTSSPPATSTAPCSRVSLCSRISLVYPGRVDPIPGLALF